MADITITQGFTLFVILMIVGVVFVFAVFTRITTANQWLNRMYSPSGGYDWTKIIAILLVAAGIYGVLSFVLVPKKRND